MKNNVEMSENIYLFKNHLYFIYNYGHIVQHVGRLTESIQVLKFGHMPFETF